MSRNFQRPENALRRAEEFLDVQKPSRALDALYDFIKSKRLRSSNYSEKVLEPIMLKYLTLCVDLKRSHVAKEGLYQYRNICQTVNVASLEKVVREYLAMAEKKTENAREASHQAVQAVVAIDDLDNVASPESLLLSAVSGEDAQDRTDRAILTPWVRFLWESYRQCLELLRINPRLERLYHDIAQMAFKFCLKYARKTEFRKLCDSLRTHLSTIAKQQASGVSGGIHLTNVETLAMNSETRLAQLDAAIQMELWQEAYKAIEDINGLTTLSKKMPRPQVMANYYQKLSLIFWKGGNLLFHAATLFRLFSLSREMKKNISSNELTKMAGQVVMATLGVPLPSLHPEFDRFIETEKNSMEKIQRLAALLNLPGPPTRQGLIRDLVRLQVLPYAPPHLQRLYHILETEFQPFHMCKEVQSILTTMSESDDSKHLGQYAQSVQDMALVRLIKQVAQVYQTIDFDRLQSLAAFASPFYLQRIIVDLVRHNDMQIRIDHKDQSIHFGLGMNERAESEMREGGVTLQPMPADQIRFQLIEMARALEEAHEMIEPDTIRDERMNLKRAIHKTYHNFKDREHRRMLSRQQIIEDRKEMLETLTQQRAEEERRAIEEEMERTKRAEEERLTREMKEREERRKLSELEQIREKQREERLKQLTATAVGTKVLASLNEKDLETIDADVLMQRQVEELEKERTELQSRMKNQMKKLDHTERAKRLEEIPLLQKAYDERKVLDKEFWEKEEVEMIEEAKKERAHAIETANRLERARDDYDEFMGKLMDERNAKFEERMAEFQAMLAEERKVRLAERKDKRKEQRRLDWEEERKRKAEEEERKRREEEKEKERADREKSNQVAAERMRREQEVEEKRKKELEETMASLPREEPRRAQPGPRAGESDWRRGGEAKEKPRGWQPSAGSETGWRARQKEKDDEWKPKKDERGPEEEEKRNWREERGPERNRPASPPRRTFGDREEGPRSRGFDRDEAPRDGPRAPPERRPLPRDDGPPSRSVEGVPKMVEDVPKKVDDRVDGPPAAGGASGRYVPPSRREEGERERPAPAVDRERERPAPGPDRERDRDAPRTRGDFRDSRGPPPSGPRDFDRGPRDGDREQPRRSGAEEGPWRRGGGDRDRDAGGPPRRMEGGPRDGPRDGPRGGPRDGPRDSGPRAGTGSDSGPWRKGADDKGPGGRDFGRDDRRGGPPREGAWGRGRDDRDKDAPSGGSWRSAPRQDDGPRREERR